ncbi:MAG TPA: M28 family peptidase [Bryobacteraceae bacterium]|nr:M28 family peptidase [Bryobacteraceae bacterium]
MRSGYLAAFLVFCLSPAILGQTPETSSAPGAPPASTPAPPPDPLQPVIDRLSLERYKSTIRGLTQFGDRRQGTDRNRAALDWIEQQLKSYGCANVERISYTYTTPPGRGGRGASPNAEADATATGSTPAATAGGRGGRGPARGGARPRGERVKTGVNNDANAQTDEKLRALNSQPSAAGPRQEVYCTKVGTTHPEEGYIVAAHMDGIGWGEAANDDGSGTALVMEVARVLNSPDVQTERSVRFALWNNEETGLNGSRAYVDQRKDLQGKEDTPGSGKYSEPRWLGLIQHDMLLFDHGMPHDGVVSKEQRAEADVNIEFQSASKQAAQSAALGWTLVAANEKFATDYPAALGNHMTNTDSTPFQDLVASVSVRENERGGQIGSGWDPHWHQPTDVYATFSDKDFRLGLNAAQTTLGAVLQLTGARLVK